MSANLCVLVYKVHVTKQKNRVYRNTTLATPAPKIQPASRCYLDCYPMTNLARVSLVTVHISFAARDLMLILHNRNRSGVVELIWTVTVSFCAGVAGVVFLYIGKITVIEYVT